MTEISDALTVSSYDPDPDAPILEIAHDLSIRSPGSLVVCNEPRRGFSVEFRVELLEQGLRPTVVTVRSLEHLEIAATDLRAVNMQRLWRAHIPHHVQYAPESAWEMGPGGRPFMRRRGPQLTDAELELMRLRGPDSETLGYVAAMYSLASFLGLAPALYVQESFSGQKLDALPRTTATKWIRKARDLGLIAEGQRPRLIPVPKQWAEEDVRREARTTYVPGGAEDGDH